MNIEEFNLSLFGFLNSVPTPYHAVTYIAQQLREHNFLRLDESKSWDIKRGSKYFCIRNGSIIAFTLGINSAIENGFRMVGAHTDSPSLQIKPLQKKKTDPYLLFGVEKYGGALLSTWFDRELSLAGQAVIADSEKRQKIVSVDFKRPLLFIPSLAIHLNRDANKANEINVHNHMSPIYGQLLTEQVPNLHSLILDQINKQYPDLGAVELTGFDLFCYDISKSSYFGLNDEFIAAPRLDNLVSCFVGLKAITSVDKDTNTFLICCNHEEIGSRSESGALGNFPRSIVARLLSTPENQAICLHNSFLLSLDNAHATHPNFLDKHDADHHVILNKGPVIKLNANQRYSSTALSASLIRKLCSSLKIDFQDFVMRSDLPCGSTIGPLTSSQLGVVGVDVGIPTWGMHSIREVTGRKDPELLYQLTQRFLNQPTLPPFRA